MKIHLIQPMVLFLLLTHAAVGQNSPQLEAYLKEGLTNNLALKQQDLNVQRSIEAVKQARSLFYPTLQFDANYTRAVGGRSIDFPIGDLLNPVYQTLNELTQSSQFPQVQNETIQFLPDNFQETKVKFSYPLYNSDLRYNRNIQQNLYDSQVATRAAYENELIYQITDAYLQYLKALEAEKIWANTKEVYTELRRFNESLVKNNVATRDIIATADYELARTDYQIFQLQADQNTARAYFNFLLNRDQQAPIEPDTTLLRPVLPVYDKQQLVTTGLNNRQELEALRSGLEAAETNIKRNEAQMRIPDFYIGGEFGFQGFGYNFGDDQAFALAQVGLTYDLFDAGLRKSRIQEAKIESEQMRTRYNETQQKIALQITRAWNDFDAARKSYLASRNATAAAEESYRIINNKYRANQALLIELLDAENRVTSARLQSLLEYAEVLRKEAALKQAAALNQ
ncbi:MAG: TolC family protein [Saprospiraceae bacterium]|nr:TolC family protein [Saprospiraceae bacterium]MCC6413556.1 TolC family protein [Saprospiraceae bacterium]